MKTRWSTPRTQGTSGALVDGYVMDTPYFEPVNVDLCPAWLSMVSVLHGQPPVDMTGPITWVDLGCGSGIEACAVAAANPDITVWGCDVNPAHVERARALARTARLENCTFDEATFEVVAADMSVGPTNVDVIVVQGVYSWVSTANQRHVVDFIRQRLRPGGLAYVMYEAATGWSAMPPLAEVLRLHAELDRRRSDLAFRDAAAAITELAEGGAQYFPLAPREASEFASWRTANAFYAAHEYLGTNFRPLLFDDVARDMQRARCTYVGSIESTDAMSAFWAPPQLADLVAGTDDIVLQQMLRDLVTMRALRRDVYRRGTVVANPVELEGWQRELSLVGTGKPFDEASPVEVPIGEVNLDRGVYEPLVVDVASGEIDVASVTGRFPAWSATEAVNAMALLVAGGYARPAARSWRDRGTRASARRMNETLIDANLRGGDHHHLVTPATGSTIESEFVEMLTLGAVWRGADRDVEQLAIYVLDVLVRQQRGLQEVGALVTDPSETAAIARTRIRDALDRLDGIYVRLGISG